MFRVRDSEIDRRNAVVQWLFCLGLVLSLLLNAAAAYLAWVSYRALDAAGLNPAGTYVDIRLGATLLGATIPALCIVAMLWLRRRYLSSQHSLRQLKMLAHDILASMDRGVITTNPEGTITSINSAAMRILELDLECVGRPLVSGCPAKVPLGEVHREVVGKQLAIRDRDFVLGRGGRVLRLRVDGHVLNDDQGASLGCVIHLRDVTERILMEERMHRMERFLSMATLASGLHHEIKNPLTALSIHIQLLEEALSKGHNGEPVNDMVGVLRTEVCRLNGVLESFRSFANLQRLTIEPTNALEVVEDAIQLIRPQAAEQNVKISLVHTNAPPAVPLDGEKFKQVVLNLLINALEAMPEGGHLTVSVSTEESELRVSVQDTGTGIAPELQPNLFQPYFSTKEKGSGMGLALSEKLIGQHGGHIDYRTGPQGTTFDIAIPLSHGGGVA